MNQWQCLLKISNNTSSLLLEKELIEREVELFSRRITYSGDPSLKQGQDMTRVCYQRDWIVNYFLRF